MVALPFSKNPPLSSAQVEYLGRQETALNAIREHLAFTRKYQQLGAQAPAWQNVEELVRKAKTQIFFNKVRFSCIMGGPLRSLLTPCWNGSFTTCSTMH